MLVKVIQKPRRLLQYLGQHRQQMVWSKSGIVPFAKGFPVLALKQSAVTWVRWIRVLNDLPVLLLSNEAQPEV